LGAVREVQTKAVSDFGAMGALHSHDNQNHGHVQDFLEKAKKVFEEKWVVNPKKHGHAR